MNILITGASGFLGYHLVKQLSLNLDFNLFIFHRKNSDLSLINNYKFSSITGDITHQKDVENALKDMDYVFHLAGLIAYDKRKKNLMEKINVLGTQYIVEACLKHNIKRLVYLSSVVTIGANQKGISLNEQSDPALAYSSQLNLGYFDTKKDAEEIVIKAVLQKKLNAISLNPSTIYGPADSKKTSRSTQLKVAQGKFKFYTPGGVNVVHVDNVVECCIKALKIGKPGETYIIGGENLSIKQLFTMIANEAKQTAPSIKLSKFLLKIIGKIGDIINLCGGNMSLTTERVTTSFLYHWYDSTKAQKTFNYKPISAQIAIKDSIAWSKDNNIL